MLCSTLLTYNINLVKDFFAPISLLVESKITTKNTVTAKVSLILKILFYCIVKFKYVYLSVL